MKTSIWLGGLSLVASALFSVSVHARDAYTVHEWGTFTSFQGGDGKLLAWNPLQSAELPGFVHSTSLLAQNYWIGSPTRVYSGIKGSMITLQRMETPVMYFYPAKRMTVDVSVDFPQGLITEWYPQVTAFGPMNPLGTNAHPIDALSQSRAVWRNLELIPASTTDKARLLQDAQGSHYFAARATASALVQTQPSASGQHPAETEKYIFYRGAGDFTTPLFVSVDDKSQVTVKNTGSDNLAHLFLVSIHGQGESKTGAWAQLDHLAPGQNVKWKELNAMPLQMNSQPIEGFQAHISTYMTNALVAAGLYPDEAAAMVNTWKDSWFSEEGDRVLYILPRAWTDETLPLTLNPAPEKLVRVMVGRAEIFSPAQQNNLRENLTRAASGDSTAREAAAHEIKALGRFAIPALGMVNIGNPSTNAVELSYQLVAQAVQSGTQSNLQ